ncbi:MAG: Zn-dependent oligopeptidase [Proteobacteria bacterium]|nr:Zn-dependent oligopeptidase [Pseudomonadota bacterium]
MRLALFAPLLLLVTALASGAEARLQPALWSDHPDAAALDRRVDGYIASARRHIATLKAVRGRHTIENTLRPYDAATLDLNTGAYLASLVQQVHPDATFRDRGTAAYVRASSAQTDVQLDPGVYAALKAIDLSGADATTRYYVERLLLVFKLAGVDRDAATRAQVKALNDRLTELVSHWDRNIADDARHISADPAELEGLPADFIAGHAPGADGKVTITTAYPDVTPVMTFARSKALRTRLLLEFTNRGYPVNRQVLADMLASREQLANLLGFANWADLFAADKMARNGNAVAAFIEQIAAAARPGAQREFALLLAEKRRQEPDATVISVAERSYYAELVRRSSYSFDSQSARPYFPFARVKQGLLDVAAEFFAVSFEREPATRFWDDSVESWLVRDQGQVIGRVYFDLHPRAGKYSHAEMVAVLDGVRGRQLPEAMLICNFPQPTATDPGLMSYDSVQTFFHEFGHLLHHILGGRQPYAGVSGISMESDFVEAPSQMLEELLRSPRVLARFARHYETGAPIPEELVARMNRAAAFGRSIWVENQNGYSALSFDLHRRKAAGVDPSAVEAAVEQRYTRIAPIEGTHEWASFGHLGGYSSAYYTYLWDKVIAVDFYGQFDAANPMAGDAPRRYRRLVLEPGGSRSANELVHDFLGRAQSTEALQRWMNQEFQDSTEMH